jgi:hypothetical protein
VEGPSSATVDRLCGTYKIVRQSTKRQRVAAALKWYTSSLELSQELSKSDPLNTEFERDVAMSYLKIASAHANLHNSTDTFAALQRYRPSRKTLATEAIAQKCATSTMAFQGRRIAA